MFFSFFFKEVKFNKKKQGISKMLITISEIEIPTKCKYLFYIIIIFIYLFSFYDSSQSIIFFMKKIKI